MATLTAETLSPTAVRSGPQVTLGVVGLVMTANAVGPGSMLLFDSRDYSEVAGTGLHLVHYTVATLCLVALSQVYPALTGLRGAGGRRLPVVVLRAAAVGAALAACGLFTQTFVPAYLSAEAPALLDVGPGAILMAPMLAVSVAAGLTTVAFGIAAGTRRVIPWPAVALLVIGGLAQPAVGPLAAVFVGAGLVWTATRGASDLPGAGDRA